MVPIYKSNLRLGWSIDSDLHIIVLTLILNRTSIETNCKVQRTIIKCGGSAPLLQGDGTRQRCRSIAIPVEQCDRGRTLTFELLKEFDETHFLERFLKPNCWCARAFGRHRAEFWRLVDDDAHSVHRDHSPQTPELFRFTSWRNNNSLRLFSASVNTQRWSQSSKPWVRAFTDTNSKQNCLWMMSNWAQASRRTPFVVFPSAFGFIGYSSMYTNCCCCCCHWTLSKLVCSDSVANRRMRKWSRCRIPSQLGRDP